MFKLNFQILKRSNNFNNLTFWNFRFLIKFIKVAHSDESSNRKYRNCHYFCE